MTNTVDRIKAHPFFRSMKPEHLDILATGAAEVKFQEGDTLFLEGEPANQCFLLESGSIAVEAHEPASGTVVIEHLKLGDVLGWSWLFQPFEWHFQARAIEPTTAIALNGAHILIAAERDHEFGYELMKRMAQMVIRRLHGTRRRLMTPNLSEK